MGPTYPTSLRTHLTADLSVGDHHDRLMYRDDCPICREERPAATSAGGPSTPRRARAALAAGVLALSALGPGGAALASAVPVDEEGTAEPQAPQRPGEEAPAFDPGAEEPLETEGPEAAPIPGGDEEDDSEGAPLEAEPEGGLEVHGEVAPAPPDPNPPVPPDVAPAPAEPVIPPAIQPPPPAALRPEVPLLERGMPARPPLLEVTIPPSGGGDDAARSLPQSVGGQQPNPPPATGDGGLSGLSAPGPLAPAIPDAAVADVRSPDRGVQRSEASSLHIVRSGESLWSIAERLAGPDASDAEIAAAVDRLWELNDERIGTGSPDLLPVGTKLLLP